MATISKSVTVANGGVYTIELNAIPDGKTVTPVNDIQTWLHCGDIWDKSYTTIDQVLEDAGTFQDLIASSNAADYMARSTSWTSSICTNANAMTYIGVNDHCADTLLGNATWRGEICNSTYFEMVLNVKAPIQGGTPFADSTYSGYPADYMFNGLSDLGWSPASKGNHRCGYNFNKKITVYKIGASRTNAPADSTTAKCQGLNANNVWENLPIDDALFYDLYSYRYSVANSVPPQYQQISFYGYFGNGGNGYHAQIWGR